MGLFDWIFDTLVGGSPGQKSKRAPTSQPGSTSGGKAVATIERPEAAPSADAEADEPWWQAEGDCPKEAVPLVRPEMSHEARALENALFQQFDGHDLTMPPMPTVPQRVLKELRSSKCSFAKIADDIAEDQVVAASVLRAVNSPLYRGVHEITSLQLGVARIGSSALRTLMMHQALRAATFIGKGGDKHLAEIVWRRSVASACIMSGLSKFTDVSEDEAWLIGLMHDVGNVIVLRVMQSEHTINPKAIDPDSFEYLCYESHQEFGELIADAWNLPPTLKAILSNHHPYPEPDDPLRSQRLAVHLTDMIASLLGYAPTESYNLLETRAVQDLGLADREDFVSHLKHLPAQVQDAMIYF